MVKTIPNGISRFLLESDWHPLDFDFDGSNRLDVDKILLNGLITISSMLDLSPEVMAAHFESNTPAFLVMFSFSVAITHSCNIKLFYINT